MGLTWGEAVNAQKLGRNKKTKTASSSSSSIGIFTGKHSSIRKGKREKNQEIGERVWKRVSEISGDDPFDIADSKWFQFVGR